MNMDTQMKKREQVSALADGQLEGLAWADALQCAADDGDGRDSWHTYHVIGDVLRARDLGACGHDRAFVERLRVRLQAESAVISAAAGVTKSPELIASNGQVMPGTGQKYLRNGREGLPAANDGIFRWKMLAGLASLAAVMAIGWNALNSLEAPAGARLAQSGSAPALIAGVPVTAPVADAGAATPGTMVMLRDPRLDELLAAHRQFGGTSALQNPSGFLRNATFEGGAR